MQEEARHSGMSNLAKSFTKAWGEIGAGVVKDANNPHFDNDYASLSAVTALVKPILAKHDLAFLQTPGQVTGDHIEIIGLLIHSSGESITFKTAIPLGGKVTAQSAGSAITYGRRYQLLAVFGLAPVDDDGNAASAPVAAKKTKAKEPEAEDETYADRKAVVETAISGFKGTADELEKTVRPRVEDLGDEDVNKQYVEKRRQLKAAAKGKQ